MLYKNILETIKINHYLKNIIIFIPLLLSSDYNKPSIIFISFITFIAFCFISSSVYIFNDLIDINSDIKHPIKRNRPIAGKKITEKSAVFLFLIFLIFSITISYFINIRCLILICSYFILNIFYSLFLKKIAFVDIICIAIGFILRIEAGYISINQAKSITLILLIFFTSLFVTSIKRKLEFMLSKQTGFYRESIQKLAYDRIEKLIDINLYLVLIFYFLLMFQLKNIYAYITLFPFLLIMLRLKNITNNVTNNDDPMFFIINDNIIKYLFVFYVIFLFLYVYTK